MTECLLKKAPWYWVDYGILQYVHSLAPSMFKYSILVYEHILIVNVDIDKTLIAADVRLG